MPDLLRSVLGFGTKTRIVPQSDYQGMTLLDSTEQLEIDCTIREAASHDAEPTELPVEEGADITDHVRTKPDSLQLEFILSNDPLDNPIPGFPSLDPFRADDGYRKLLNWQAEKQLLAVVTPHRAFESMVITNISPEWDNRTGMCVRGTISFKEIVRVETQTVTLAQGSLAPKKKSGLKKMPPAEPAKRASALAALRSWVKG